MDSIIFLGKYRVAEEGIGAVGDLTVAPQAHEGEEIDSGKKVVVEVVPAASLKTVEREQLQAEAIAAKKLSHVNIPALYDFGVEDDHLVYVTEDFEGTLAEEWVNTHGPMPVGPVLRIALQVVSALGAAAFHQIVHRAINPSNLVLVPGETAEGDWPLVKVLHFVGVAPKFSGTDVSVTAFDKSLHYASPEQIQGGTVDFRSEIYSLGCTMWFLLIGAPPLTASKGPLAVQPTKTDLAVEALPRKLRGLLAEMLSVDPDARPHDPLAFYRQLQDCLVQVERRATMAPESGVPTFSPTRADGTPRPRRTPLKALARAAIFLAMAALAALILRGYLQHRRVVHAEEPIGVPAESASTKQVAVAPAPPATPDSPPNPQAREPLVTVNNATTLPASTYSPAVAATSKVEAQQPASKKTIMRDVRRAESVEPEVRRAEPASPEEGPAEVAPETKSVAKTEPNREVEAEAPETPSLVLKRTDSKPEVAPKSHANKTEQPAKPKRKSDEKIYLLPGREFETPSGRLPRGSVRGRFMGVTPDGRWMFELPSHEIVIVPPPPSSP